MLFQMLQMVKNEMCFHRSVKENSPEPVPLGFGL